VIHHHDRGARGACRGRRLACLRLGRFCDLGRLRPCCLVLALLAGRTHRDDAAAAREGRQLLQLAFAHHRRGREPIPPLRHARDDLEAERLGEPGQLVERRLELGLGDAGQLHADQDSARAGGGGCGGAHEVLMPGASCPLAATYSP